MRKEGRSVKTEGLKSHYPILLESGCHGQKAGDQRGGLTLEVRLQEHCPVFSALGLHHHGRETRGVTLFLEDGTTVTSSPREPTSSDSSFGFLGSHLLVDSVYDHQLRSSTGILGQ